MVALFVCLALLGQADDDTSIEGPPGTNVLICHGPSPSCTPPVRQRAIIVKTIVDIPSCPPPPELPNEDDIFPEAIFLQAHRVRFDDGPMPDVFDLRAFGTFQNRIGEHAGFVSGEPCTYTITSRVTGQWPLVLRDADPTMSAMRWIRAYVRPPELPDTWCDFDGDEDVDRDDWVAFFGRMFTGKVFVARGG